MADIDIQKKKTPIWPWIVGILAAIILIWLLVSYFNNDGDVRDNNRHNDRDTTRGGAYLQPADSKLLHLNFV